jgi:hypothetical protein
MAAPVGNQFWNLRLKHGKDSIIKNPETLWVNFLQYAEWVELNPLLEQNWAGKDGDEVFKRKMRPMLKPAFAVVCGYSEWNSISELKRKGQDYTQIISRIEACITSWNVSGSAAGFLNPNIIARVEGLSEQTEVKHSGESEIIIKGQKFANND